jgi:hypothetical protein
MAMMIIYFKTNFLPEGFPRDRTGWRGNPSMYCWAETPPMPSKSKMAPRMI